MAASRPGARLLRGREGTAKSPKWATRSLPTSSRWMGVLPPQPAPFRSWKVGILVIRKGLGRPVRRVTILRCVVVVVLVGAQHQVPGQAQRGKARDVVVLIGVQHHGEVPAGQGKAGVAVPTYRQLFPGKTSLWSGISRSLCPYCTIFPRRWPEISAGKEGISPEIFPSEWKNAEEHSIIKEKPPEAAKWRDQHESDFGNHGGRHGLPLRRREANRRHWPPTARPLWSIRSMTRCGPGSIRLCLS